MTRMRIARDRLTPRPTPTPIFAASLSPEEGAFVCVGITTAEVEVGADGCSGEVDVCDPAAVVMIHISVPELVGPDVLNRISIGYAIR
jgi:hypothetical protein